VTVTEQTQHSHAMCEDQAVEPTQPVIIGFLIFSILGLFIWAVGVFIVVAGNKSVGFSAMSASYFALFFCVVCALVPLAHISGAMSSTAFWWTCLTTIYGWSIIIVSLRQADDSNCGNDATQNYACHSLVASVAGAAILLFVLTFLCGALWFFYLLHDHSHEHNKAVMRDPFKGGPTTSSVTASPVHNRPEVAPASYTGNPTYGTTTYGTTTTYVGNPSAMQTQTALDVDRHRTAAVRNSEMA